MLACVITVTILTLISKYVLKQEPSYFEILIVYLILRLYLSESTTP